MLIAHCDHNQVEEGKYAFWLSHNYFLAGDKSKPAFCLVIPPPNVTGKLHLGHVMDETMQDILARYKRARGYDVLYLPGTDHAGIATQAKVEAILREEGLNRFDLGREKFLEKVWQWKDEYAHTIHEQWAKVGISVDYSRERFTLDEGLSKAVKEVFVTLYEQGLIYRGERIINWDPQLKTALSNIEVVHSDDEGEFFYFKYDVIGEDKSLIVATTRPETMFGDTAIFVNPKDKRYTSLVGKKAINPANGEPLPIMADSYVDPSFGTGVMKCTPAHDPNDFLLAKKYSFPFIKALDESAVMNEKAGIYKGMDRYQCRKALVEKIKQEGHLDHIEKMVHSVGHSERSGVVVEPMLSKQWFVKMRPLADALLKTMKGPDKIEFLPERFEKVLNRWMEEADDWCISRQLWWGHRIPAYYNKQTGELLITRDEPDPNLWVQDEDVLDTWFSSALWPFSTLGWPNNTDDLKRYFPTDTMVTGYDIIFFWVARMAFQSIHFLGKPPFKQVLIHGLIRDEQGRKMSKSLGNGIDPIDVIGKYGADALRYFITTNASPGQDMRYSEEKVASSAAYLNKIWNAARYVEMNLGEDYVPTEINPEKLGTLEKFILTKLNQTITKVTEEMEQCQFGMASNILYDFVYDDFCSFYLEMSKVSLANNDNHEQVKAVLYKVIKSIVLLIYPYCPFICEEIYQSLPGHETSIMEESYPKADSSQIFKVEAKNASLLSSIIKDVRGYKSAQGMQPNAPIDLIISGGHLFDGAEAYLKRFLFASNVEYAKEAPKGDCLVYGRLVVTIANKIDPSIQRATLEKEKEKVEADIARSESLLNNPGFMAKAPQAKIEAEQTALKENKQKLSSLLERLSSL